ncbi:MAG: lipoyl(octanoyl) transferase LipB [Bdellovibrionales bacterium]|nr:lipoyl(octanoyl) transferase LipB [Bdellovibrionales bacterium]
MQIPAQFHEFNPPRFLWLGTVDYSVAMELQQSYLKAENADQLPIILGLEHPSVITLGVRGSADDVLSHDVPVVKTTRGGQATLHNPGQLVIYPLLSLKAMNITVRNFVEAMLEVSAQTLKNCNITIDSQKDGLFTSVGKICSAGFNIKNGKTSHGLAINVRNDLVEFSKIRACGVTNSPMDRVSHYDPDMTPENLFEIWKNEFLKSVPGTFCGSGASAKGTGYRLD